MAHREALQVDQHDVAETALLEQTRVQRHHDARRQNADVEFAGVAVRQAQERRSVAERRQRRQRHVVHRPEAQLHVPRQGVSVPEELGRRGAHRVVGVEDSLRPLHVQLAAVQEAPQTGVVCERNDKPMKDGILRTRERPMTLTHVLRQVTLLAEPVPKASQVLLEHLGVVVGLKFFAHARQLLGGWARKCHGVVLEERKHELRATLPQNKTFNWCGIFA